MDLLNADKSQIEKLVAELDSKGYNTSQKAIMAARIANAERGRAPANAAGRITQVDICRQLGVSRSLVYWAKLLVSKSSDTKILELIDRIEKGALTLTEACKIAGLRQTRVSIRTLNKISESELGKRVARALLLMDNVRWHRIVAEADIELQTEADLLAVDPSATYDKPIYNLMQRILDGEITIDEGYEGFTAWEHELYYNNTPINQRNFSKQYHLSGDKIDISLFLDDAKRILSSIANNSVDLVLTDPPYNTNVDFWDKDFDVKWVMREFERILRPGGSAIIFCSDKILPDYLSWQSPVFTKSRLKYYQMMLWHKTNPHLKSTDYSYNYSTELILWFIKDLPDGNIAEEDKELKEFIGRCVTYHPRLINKVLNGKMSENVFSLGHIGNRKEKLRTKSGKAVHKTQKPDILISSLLQVHSNEGDLVCDPFAGTASTAAMCYKHGRKYVGSEMLEYYYRALRSRFPVSKCINIETLPPIFPFYDYIIKRRALLNNIQKLNIKSMYPGDFKYNFPMLLMSAKMDKILLERINLIMSDNKTKKQEARLKKLTDELDSLRKSYDLIRLTTYSQRLSKSFKPA